MFIFLKHYKCNTIYLKKAQNHLNLTLKTQKKQKNIIISQKRSYINQNENTIIKSTYISILYTTTVLIKYDDIRLTIPLTSFNTYKSRMISKNLKTFQCFHLSPLIFIRVRTAFESHSPHLCKSLHSINTTYFHPN